MILAKTYSIPAGGLQFDFEYGETYAGELDDFDILNIGELSYGYDNENNIDIAIYPSNIDITIDDQTGDNYNRFRELMNNYSTSYPLNYAEVFRLVIKLNDAVIFTGLLDELESDKDSWELTLKFVDGINKLKELTIDNPYVLKRLNERGIINSIPHFLGSSSFAYGFGKLWYSGGKGYYVDNITEGNDRDTNLRKTIEEMFKLFDVGMSIDFSNEYKFGDLQVTTANMVTIDRVNIRRILSHLIGRYVVIKKGENAIPSLYFRDGLPDYTRPEYFKKVYEDSQYVVFFHDWNGTVGSVLFWKGIDEKLISDVLKVIARNLFSYFGFKANKQIFFRHRRFTQSPVELDSIISMTKLLTIEKIQGTKIEDYFESKAPKSHYGTHGFITGANNESIINYKIPFNAYLTSEVTGGYDYRLNYFVSGVEKRVIKFYDQQLGAVDFPDKLLSLAEWTAHKEFKDKYEFELSGIDYDFDKTYSVNQYNYSGIFRPVELKKNLLENKTSMTAIEI